MTRATVLLKTTIFLLCLIKIGGTYTINATTIRPESVSDVNITTMRPESAAGDSEDTEEFEYKPEPCLSGKCIFKCCPDGQIVKRKRCIEDPKDYNLNFTGLEVYNENLYKTGKNVAEVFTILRGKMLDGSFRNKYLKNTYGIGYITYILETGDLQLELPNSYYHWTLVKNGNFCIDYGYRKKVFVKSPMIYTQVVVPEVPKSSDYLSGGMLVSCFFLLLVFIVYLLLPELQNICGMILMAYVFSLFMCFLLMANIQLGDFEDEGCVNLTYAIYYFFISTFCWMSVMSYDIWWTFRGYAKVRPIHRRGESFKFLMYGLYAWGIPLLMTCFLAKINVTDMRQYPWFITPQVPTMGCFLEGGVKLVYLYTPMLILIVCNWMFYLMTAFNVWRLSRGTAVLDSAAAGTPAAHRSQRNRFMVYLKLSTVMGLNWLLEIVSFLYPGSLWYITDAYNFLIGLVIFLIFVCKRKILRKLYKRYAMKNTRRFYPGSSKSYSSSHNSESSNPESTSLQICTNPKGLSNRTGSIRST